MFQPEDRAIECFDYVEGSYACKTQVNIANLSVVTIVVMFSVVKMGVIQVKCHQFHSNVKGMVKLSNK